MKDFSQILIQNKQETANVNEFVGAVLALSCLAFACSPLLSKIGERIAKGGDKKDGGGATFWDFLIAKTTKSKNDKENDSKEDDSKEDNSKEDNSKRNQEVFNQLLMISKKSNEKEKDENTKKKNDAMLKLLTACSFDKDGNEIPLEERMDKMKDTMSPEQFEAFKKDMIDTYEKNKDNQDFKDALVKAKSNIKPEEYDKMIEEAKKEAKTTLNQLDKEKEEIEKHEEEIKKLEDEINGGDEKDKEIRELKRQLEELKKNPPQTMTAVATGVAVGGNSTSSDDDKKTETSSDDDIEKKLAAVDKKYKKQEEDLEKEYNEKIKNEPDKDKKKQLEDEWSTKQKEIDKQKNKEKDDIDDTDDHTDDDETKNGKYKVQDEEIKDPETGEKKKVKTYTGPRGGKFYYPDGKPKKPENKVYLESISLSDYIYNMYYD